MSITDSSRAPTPTQGPSTTPPPTFSRRLRFIESSSGLVQLGSMKLRERSALLMSGRRGLRFPALLGTRIWLMRSRGVWRWVGRRTRCRRICVLLGAACALRRFIGPLMTIVAAVVCLRVLGGVCRGAVGGAKNRAVTDMCPVR